MAALSRRRNGRRHINFFAAILLVLLHKANATNEAGTQWLEKQREEGAVETPSGLMYKELFYQPSREDGGFHPAFDAYCKIDLEIKRVLDENGKTEVVESSEIRVPILVRPEDTLPAVQEALQLMVEGDWWELFVPSHLGYTDDYRHKHKGSHVQGDEALLISLELKEISHGDKLPAGEVHNCFISIEWDAHNGNYFYQPNHNCEGRDQKYIAKVTDWVDRSIQADAAITRLRKLLQNGNQKQELSFWIRRRIHLLKQFLKEEMRICSLFYQGDEIFQDDCNVKEQEYNTKVTQWEASKIGEELDRLTHMDQTSMEPALASWVRRRIRILNQIRKLKDEKPSSQPNNLNEEADQDGERTQPTQQDNGEESIQSLHGHEDSKQSSHGHDDASEQPLGEEL